MGLRSESESFFAPKESKISTLLLEKKVGEINFWLEIKGRKAPTKTWVAVLNPPFEDLYFDP